MSKPEEFSFTTEHDARGCYIKMTATLRTVQQLEYLTGKLPIFGQFIEPEVEISALAADRFVDTEEIPVVLPALKLIA